MMYPCNRIVLLLLAFTLELSHCQSNLQAASIYADFDGEVALGNGAPSSSFAAAAGAPGFWNVVLADQLLVPLLDVDGNATGVTISNGAGAQNANQASTSGDVEKLLDDGIDKGNGLPFDVTIAGLDPGPYEIYTYAWHPASGGESIITRITLNGQAPQDVSRVGDFTGFILGDTHAFHSFTLPAGQNLVITAQGIGGSNTAVVDGVQIVSLFGDIFIDEGVLQVGSDAEFGFASNDLVFRGGTLQLSGSFDHSRGITVNAEGGWIDTNNFDQRLNGTVEGSGVLTKLGAGTLTLSVDSQLSGGVSIAGGTIRIEQESSLGSGSFTFAANDAVLQLADDLSLENPISLSAAGILDAQQFDVTLLGDISGSGSIEKDGTGTLALSGNNDFTGGLILGEGTLRAGIDAPLGASNGSIVFNGGTLQLTGSFNQSRTITVSTGGGWIDTNSYNQRLSGVIDGIGELSKQGQGTLTLAGDNSLMGGIAIAAGTIQLEHAKALGSGALSFAAPDATLRFGNAQTVGNSLTLTSSGTIDTQQFAATLTGDIGGMGALTKAGSGTLTLSGNNDFSGGLILEEGTLRTGMDTQLGSPAGTIEFNGGSLQLTGSFDHSRAITVDAGGGWIDTQAFSQRLVGVIDGNGNLTVSGSRTLTLAGENVLTGGITITGGTIQVDAADALGTGSFAFSAAGATLLMGGALDLENRISLASGGIIDTQHFETGFRGDVCGAGSLTKLGSGTLTLFGSNDFAGGLILEEGTVRAEFDAQLGALNSPLIFGGGTVQLTGSFDHSRLISVNADGGRIDTSSFDQRLTGIIDGPGVLTKTGSGTLILAGDNQHSGGVTLEGGAIEASTRSALGTGTITFGAVGTLLRLGASFDLDNPFSVTSSARLDTQQFSSTLLGDVSGTGSLTKIGTGTLALLGTNSFAGGWILEEGTLRAGLDTQLGALSSSVAFGGGTLQLSGGFDHARIVTLGEAGGWIDTDGFEQRLTGVIEGPGSLTKLGSGTLSIAGENQFAGGITLLDGTLQIDHPHALGTGPMAIASSDAILRFVSSLEIENSLSLVTSSTLDTGTFDAVILGQISGSGSLTKRGSGSLVLSAMNSFSGGLILREGTVSIANDANLGVPSSDLEFDGGTLLLTSTLEHSRTFILNAAGGRIDTNGFDHRLSGLVDGPGMLTKTGSGTLTLPSANIHSGGTSIVDGTIALGHQEAVGSGTLTFGGTSSQLVCLAKLDIDNPISIISEGMIDVGDFDVSASGAISGQGRLTKIGTGSLLLTGLSQATGELAIEEGRLTIAGDFPGAIVVDVQGLLAGGGRTGPITNKGTIAPGAGAELSIDGEYIHEVGSVYRVSLDPTAGGDLLAIEGPATLNGGTVQIVSGGSEGFEPGTSFTLLTASEGIRGTFEGLTHDIISPFLHPDLAYTANDVSLAISALSPFSDLAKNPAQQGAARILDDLAVSATGDLRLVIDQLIEQNVTVIRKVLNEIGAASMPEQLESRITSNSQYLQTIVSRVLSTTSATGSTGSSSSTPSKLSGPVSRTAFASPGGMALGMAVVDPSSIRLSENWEGWMRGFSSNGNSDADVRFRSGGLSLGADRRVGENGRFGFSLGRIVNRTNDASRASSFEIEDSQAAVYGAWATEKRYALGLYSHGWDRYETERRLVFGTIDRLAEGTTHGHTRSGYLETGWFLRNGRASVEPLIALQYTGIEQDAYEESGAGSLNLALGDQETSEIQGSVGVRLRRLPKSRKPGRASAIPEIRLRYLKTLDRSGAPIVASFPGAGGRSFFIEQGTPENERFLTGAGFTWDDGEDVAVFLNGDTLFGSQSKVYLGEGGVRLRF